MIQRFQKHVKRRLRWSRVICFRTAAILQKGNSGPVFVP
ncbi:Uncharacterised protein [Vibrio cholerae]|nr:Uncharacterised protein [Vibrio cholerae]